MNAYPLARRLPLWCPPALESAWRDLEQRRCIWAWLDNAWQVARCRRELENMRALISQQRKSAAPSPSAAG